MAKKIPNNQYLYKISVDNPEKILDPNYIFDDGHKDLAKYVKNTKEIKNILITLKTLQSKKEQKVIVDKYFLLLAKSLNKFSNCSEFSCFISACDTFVAHAKNDMVLLKEITNRYFKKRILNQIVPEEWVQAILDSNAGRKKGKCGENKLKNILKTEGFVEVNKWQDFNNNRKCVVTFSKEFSLKNVRKKLGIKLATKKQNKNLDLIIKNGSQIFICEAKHLNTSGGAQDKQISELIEIMGLKENKNNIHYIAFLDGSYSNELLNKNHLRNKMATQKNEIEKHLRKNSNNFWLNTAGFMELF